MKHQISPEQIAFAQLHAEKMSAGASTRSFKSGTRQNTEVYFIGKIGELAVYNFLKGKNFDVVHIPFRDSYEKFNWNDDFQIKLGDRIRQIEVRTKARNVAQVRDDFKVCSDVIKPALDYIFVNYSRADNTATILGWADWRNWQAHGKEVLAGTKNENFVHKVNEFELEVRHLFSMAEYRLGFW